MRKRAYVIYLRHWASTFPTQMYKVISRKRRIAVKRAKRHCQATYGEKKAKWRVYTIYEVPKINLVSPPFLKQGARKKL